MIAARAGASDFQSSHASAVQRATRLTRTPAMMPIAAGRMGLHGACELIDRCPVDQPFSFGRSPRISRNSCGPLMSRRFRSRRSSGVADGSPISSIRRPAMSEAFAAAVGLVCLVGSEPLSAISIMRRMAPERDPSECLAAQSSIDLISARGIRVATSGSLPVAGRPLFFLGITLIDFAI